MHRYWRTNESNGIYKTEACVARKHSDQSKVLKTRGSEADVIRSTLIRSWTSEVEVIRGSEAEEWKASKDCSNAIIITPISSEE